MCVCVCVWLIGVECRHALEILKFVDAWILSPVFMLFSRIVLVCLFLNRPGIWKDLKTMGSVSLFIFFITLLVLGRQVRSLFLL